MREGLLPRRGSRSRRLGDSREAVYLFKGREAAADGLANWLGDELREDEPVALIVVDLPAGARILDTTADDELIVADHAAHGLKRDRRLGELGQIKKLSAAMAPASSLDEGSGLAPCLI